MATIDIGKIKQVWRGTYASGTAYTPDDVVQYTDSGLVSSYICIANTTGNAPSSSGTAHASWNYLAKGGAAGADGTNVATTITTQGDILYRDGSGLARLGAGTSGQLLKTQGTGANPTWVDAPVGGLVQTVSAITTGITNTSSTSFVDTGLSLNITPASSSNKIILISHFTAEPAAGASLHFDIKRTIASSATQISGDSDGLIRIQNTGNQNAVAITFKDTPNTTSQIEYQVSFRSSNGNTVYFNNAGAQASLIAMEVSV